MNPKQTSKPVFLPPEGPAQRQALGRWFFEVGEKEKGWVRRQRKCEANGEELENLMSGDLNLFRKVAFKVTCMVRFRLESGNDLAPTLGTLRAIMKTMSSRGPRAEAVHRVRESGGR